MDDVSHQMGKDILAHLRARKLDQHLHGSAASLWKTTLAFKIKPMLSRLL